MSGSFSTHRAAVVAAVATILGTVPGIANVFRARTWPLKLPQLPALMVYGWDETKKRNGVSSADMAYDVTAIVVVDIRVASESRNGEDVEAELERISGWICNAVLTSHAMFQPPGNFNGPTQAAGLVEFVNEVRTTFGINTKDSEMAVGDGRIAIEFKWSETYSTPLPDVDCEEPVFTASHLPPPYTS